MANKVLPRIPRVRALAWSRSLIKQHLLREIFLDIDIKKMTLPPLPALLFSFQMPCHYLTLMSHFNSSHVLSGWNCALKVQHFAVFTDTPPPQTVLPGSGLAKSWWMSEWVLASGSLIFIHSTFEHRLNKWFVDDNKPMVMSTTFNPAKPYFHFLLIAVLTSRCIEHYQWAMSWRQTPSMDSQQSRFSRKNFLQPHSTDPRVLVCFWTLSLCTCNQRW